MSDRGKDLFEHFSHNRGEGKEFLSIRVEQGFTTLSGNVRSSKVIFNIFDDIKVYNELKIILHRKSPNIIGTRTTRKEPLMFEREIAVSHGHDGTTEEREEVYGSAFV